MNVSGCSCHLNDIISVIDIVKRIIFIGTISSRNSAGSSGKIVTIMLYTQQCYEFYIYRYI